MSHDTFQCVFIFPFFRLKTFEQWGRKVACSFFNRPIWSMIQNLFTLPFIRKFYFALFSFRIALHECILPQMAHKIKVNGQYMVKWHEAHKKDPFYLLINLVYQTHHRNSLLWLIDGNCIETRPVSKQAAFLLLQYVAGRLIQRPWLPKEIEVTKPLK